MKYTIENKDSGFILGTYEGDEEKEAVEAMAKDAGYASLEDMEKITGKSWKDELLVYEPEQAARF